MMFGPTSDTRTLLTTGVAIVPQPMVGSDGKFGRVQAINLETGEMEWNFREVVPPVSATLSTAGGVLFVGTLDNRFLALNDTDGNILWEDDLGDIPNSFPISYGVAGKQYVAVVVGQPSVYHATVLKSYVDGFLGDESPLANLPRVGPALVVYSLN